MDEETKRDIIMENYLRPFNKEVPSNMDEYIKVNSSNESCIDNIDIYLKIEDNIVKDIKFMGEACAISTSATSIMIKTILNKDIGEVEKLIVSYDKMIEDGTTNSNLGEAVVYNEIYKQQNRKHCALLPWIGIREAIKKYKNRQK